MIANGMISVVLIDKTKNIGENCDKKMTQKDLQSWILISQKFVFPADSQNVLTNITRNTFKP